jgi:hypothetical protein
MLDHDPSIGGTPVPNVGVQPALQFERFAVTTGSEID